MSWVQRLSSEPVWRFVALGMVCACGGRTSLSVDSSFQSETSGGASSFGGNSGAGGPTSSGGGGNFMRGGAAGTFGFAGTTGFSGSGNAGEPGQFCVLSLSDCRTESQTECAATNPLCEGKASYFNRLSSLSEVHVVDVTTSPGGHIAIAGYFEGTLRSDSSSDSAEVQLLGAADGVDAFVVKLDELGTVSWAWAYGGAGEQAATGIDFAPNGDLVVQGSTKSATATAAFVARLSASGSELWSKSFGAAQTYPAQVAVDNNGDTTLAGGFEGPFEYDGKQLDHAGRAVYLLRLAADGSARSLLASVPPAWRAASAEKLVVDDEDNLIVAGHGVRQDGIIADFVQKLTPAGELWFTLELVAAGTERLAGLAVDREMRIVIGGQLSGKLALGGTTLESEPQMAQSVWLAQLGRMGEPNWARVYTADDPLLSLAALAVDPHGNIVFAGDTAKAVYVNKLRSNGDGVWLRAFATRSLTELALAADNNHNLWLGGSFADSFDWGGFVSTTRGRVDAFLVKLSP